MNRVHVHAIVKGAVQGVGFRAWAKRKAASLGLYGWTKNLEDGSVEVVLEGEEGAVAEMVDALHRGPEYAEVDELEVTYGEYQGVLNDFSVKF